MLPAPLIRSLARSRGLSMAVAGMLALGIGAFTTTFGIVDAALIRQPPFVEADRLAMLHITNTGTAGTRLQRWSYERAQLLARFATSFESVAGYSLSPLTLTGSDNPEVVSGEIVTPSYFPLLHVQPLKGRAFLTTDDDVPGSQPVVLLGYDLWQRRFAGDSSVVGRTIGVNGAALTVGGVLPRAFRGLSNRSQLWIPASMAPSLTYGAYLTTNQNFISVVGRLRQGVDIAKARTELAVLGVQIHKTQPSDTDDPSTTFSATAVALNDARVAPGVRSSILVLLAAVALLYLLASANATNLLLSRAASRRREAAVRSALGCGSARLLGFFLAEGFALTLIGGAGGIVLAMWAGRVITMPSDLWGAGNFFGSLAAFDDPVLGPRTLIFGTVLTGLTAVLVSWAPAMSMLQSDILSGLRVGARGIALGAGTLRRPTLRGAVVALEAALAVLLLVAGGLMMESFGRMRRADLGVNADHVLTFMLRASEVRVPTSAAPAFISRILDAIARVPGVQSATVDGGAPVAASARSVLYIVGRPVPPPGEAPEILRHYVAPDHFRTLGVPLLSGRAFTAADVAGQPKVAVISKSAAQRFWPNQSPLGQRVWFGSGTGFASPDSSAEIVGIVGDVVYQSLDERPNRADFYTPYTQFTYAWRMFMVRTSGDPTSSVHAIRNAVLSVEPDLPLTDVQSLTDRIGTSWARHRFDAILFGSFAAVALLLATAGIYAVVAYAVEQRTREMGIRMALGARPATVVRLVVREGMVFPFAGLLIGVIAAVASTRVLRASLYEIAPTDPVVFGGTMVILLLVSVAACLLPARRATRVDPLEALRAE